VNFPIPHLSDEAVAAFADGMLAPSAHSRAERHLAVCPECARAVDEQRAAVSILRAAPEPALPAGLLERLRSVPVTTTLTPQKLALAPDGSAVFPAFGTVDAFARPMAAAAPPAASAQGPTRRHEFHLPLGLPHPARRTQQVALVAVAAAMFTVGLAASASADTASSAPSRSVPGANSGGQPAGFVSSRTKDELVTSISGQRH
jgi:anti-sigma factor RsiW